MRGGVAESGLSELQHARTALCDLLIGREFRAIAADYLDWAIVSEREGCRVVPAAMFEKAVRAEEFARWAEWGQLLFGERHNRCGDAPGPDDTAPAPGAA
jgi:hypothetical protein